MDRPNIDIDRARSAVEEAYGALAVALVALQGLPDVEVPTDALDHALRADKAHQEARRVFGVVFNDLGDVLKRDELLFELEVKFNGVVSAATDVGFRLGAAIRTGRPARPR